MRDERWGRRGRLIDFARPNPAGIALRQILCHNSAALRTANVAHRDPDSHRIQSRQSSELPLTGIFFLAPQRGEPGPQRDFHD